MTLPEIVNQFRRGFHSMNLEPPKDVVYDDPEAWANILRNIRLIDVAWMPSWSDATGFTLMGITFRFEAKKHDNLRGIGLRDEVVS